ncbi:MAG: hypothetical protein ICV64_07980 [Thermoleophilia bacterium]|nr:hypothetical protein [Thermoleophilia bacterium]
MTATPTWNEGDVFMPRGGQRFGILEIDSFMGRRRAVPRNVDGGAVPRVTARLPGCERCHSCHDA